MPLCARGALWGPRRVPSAYGARCVRSDGQSTPAKNGGALISSVEVWPRRPSRSQSNARTCSSGVWVVRGVAPSEAGECGIREQSSHEVFGLGRQCGLGRELERLLVAEDLAARHQRVVAVEGRVPHEHLKHDDAERPPVAVLMIPGL